jgi:hypothetical protein
MGSSNILPNSNLNPNIPNNNFGSSNFNSGYNRNTLLGTQNVQNPLNQNNNWNPHGGSVNQLPNNNYNQNPLLGTGNLQNPLTHNNNNNNNNPWNPSGGLNNNNPNQNYQYYSGGNPYYASGSSNYGGGTNTGPVDQFRPLPFQNQSTYPITG